ncbi:hypothetical protein RHMOL_Rhmol02G0087500 [Rhododendron molle]|uniref:Uncharacterized protein n=1 Tax=Rhododendron molle TaxID=49168 RepID=A0ACC0PMT9_RHOML|nr:hypothetical protein RHMOL_Rhmol02G0087500 [Rhododendron molle]
MANDDLIKELENLRQLRKLSIVDVKGEHVKALYTAIEKMNHLQSIFGCWVWRHDSGFAFYFFSPQISSMSQLDRTFGNVAELDIETR